jgi:hypothetical protein
MVVASGFFGRYIYTAVPRTADGVMVEESDLRRQIAQAEAAYRRRATPSGAGASNGDVNVAAGLWGLLTRGISDLTFDLQRAWARRNLSPDRKRQATELDALIRRRRDLQRQIRFLQTARRVLALWHTIHIPIGIALFIMAFFHIGAAVYYATLLK